MALSTYMLKTKISRVVDKRIKAHGGINMIHMQNHANILYSYLLKKCDSAPFQMRGQRHKRTGTISASVRLVMMNYHMMLF